MTDSEMLELRRAIDQILEIANAFGLDPYPVHFEIVPAAIMYEFGAYGLPGRFSHWTHGRAYQQIKTQYDYGLSKIYELVINTNPAYAFLMEGNGLLQNKLVAAHVLAHVDFFKNNAYFAKTNRQMVEGVSASAERIRRYEFDHGRDEVESFLDAVLSIQEHVDPWKEMGAGYVKRPVTEESKDEEDGDGLAGTVSSPYDDLLSIGEQKPRPRRTTRPRRFPKEPEKDLLYFLAEHAPDLEDWQRDVLLIVRSEMLYFIPQMQTKILNEGWASYWHVRIMRELGLDENEFVQFAQMHAGVLAPSKQSLNPYHVGYKMFEDIERRWDSPTAREREELGRQGGEGRAKIFEVRETESDASFIRNYLTQDLVDDLDLYIYRVEGDELRVVEKDFTKIRDTILSSLTNFGSPYIVVEDADYRRSRELYLKHHFEGQEIDVDYAERTLRYVHQLWRRPVHLQTVLSEKAVLISHDGAATTRRLL